MTSPISGNVRVNISPDPNNQRNAEVILLIVKCVHANVNGNVNMSIQWAMHMQTVQCALNVRFNFALMKHKDTVQLRFLCINFISNILLSPTETNLLQIKIVFFFSQIFDRNNAL